MYRLLNKDKEPIIEILREIGNRLFCVYGNRENPPDGTYYTCHTENHIISVKRKDTLAGALGLSGCYQLSFRVSADVSGVEDHLEALHDAEVKIFCSLSEEFGGVGSVEAVTYRDGGVTVDIFAGDRADALYLTVVDGNDYFFFGSSGVEVGYVDLDSHDEISWIFKFLICWSCACSLLFTCIL